MTTIYLDVDGVLNSLSKNPPKSMTNWTGEWCKERVTISDGSTYPILWATELIDSLNTLAAREDVTFKWLTTWQDDAVNYLAPVLGLGSDWTVLHGNNVYHSLSEDWWKLKAISHDIEDTQPEKVVWIDDDIRYDKKTWTFLMNQGETIHAVSPVPVLGVTKKQVDGILEFIDA